MARWTRYLSEVVGTVVKAVAARGRPELPVEVTGPDPRTALRWFRGLFDERLKRWLLQRLRGGPPGSQGAHEMIELAESYARQLRHEPLYFFSVLQSARVCFPVPFSPSARMASPDQHNSSCAAGMGLAVWGHPIDLEV